MTKYPLLVIVILTYQRTKQALRTIKALSMNLQYENRCWYIADDGSPIFHVETLIKELAKRKEDVIGWHNKRYSPNTGIGWNQGIKIALQNSDYLMLLEDDWELSGNFDMNPKNHPGKFNINPYLNKGKMDIRPWMQMLYERSDVGLVRLGGLSVGNNVEIVNHNGHIYLRYKKDQPYFYVGGPQLRHARFMNTYGWYSENELDPGQLELDYDTRIRTSPGPDIWRPSDIPGWGLFHHIGDIRYR